MKDDAQPTAPNDEFYVGYLPAPAGLSRFFRIAAPAAALAMVALGVAIAAFQRDPGTGAWKTGEPATYEGVLVIEPYAMLRVPAQERGVPCHSILLVEQGKFGALKRSQPFVGRPVRVTGTLLARDGRKMVELAAGEEAIVEMPLSAERAAVLRDVPVETAGERTYRGELIDPKCYLGAMKPGGGKTHKACAQLCVGGGIPPMLAVRDTAGRETFLLVVDEAGGAANDLVQPFLGDPVEVSGLVERRGDLYVIRLSAGKIRRL